MKSKIMKYILTVSFAFLFCLLFAGGVGMKAEAANPTYTIHDAEDLAETAAIGPGSNTFKGQTIRLEEDIDMNDLQGTEYEGQVIRFCTADAPFAGTFDGNGHTISGLYLDMTYPNNGLFGAVRNGVISNLNVKNSLAKGDVLTEDCNSVGFVVGWMETGEIDNSIIMAAQFTAMRSRLLLTRSRSKHLPAA